MPAETRLAPAADDTPTEAAERTLSPERIIEVADSLGAQELREMVEQAQRTLFPIRENGELIGFQNLDGKRAIAVQDRDRWFIRGAIDLAPEGRGSEMRPLSRSTFPTREAVLAALAEKLSNLGFILRAE